jgi:predicted nucleic acid-binding protein
LNLFADTSVWSLALRRDAPASIPEVTALLRAVESGEPIYTTGLVLQELLQGFAGPKAREHILDKFSALPAISPDRRDHIEAAGISVACRRAGVQAGTIDALIAQLCIRHSLTLLTTDKDFTHMARHTALKMWQIA